MYVSLCIFSSELKKTFWVGFHFAFTPLRDDVRMAEPTNNAEDRLPKELEQLEEDVIRKIEQKVDGTECGYRPLCDICFRVPGRPVPKY